MADDSASFSFPTSSPVFTSPFQDESKWGEVNSNHNNKQARRFRRIRRGGHKYRTRPGSPSDILASETTALAATLSVFKFDAGMTSSPEKVAGSEKPSEKATQQGTVVEQSNKEAVKSLPLILISRVVKGMPQSPHFWPFRKCSDLAKRLLMDAWDRVFEETVDKIQSMGVDGFWIVAKELWKTLDELQGMGYNVIVLRRRLLELGDVLLEKRGFKGEIVGLMNRAEFHRMEKSRLEYEILQLKARIEDEQMRFDDLMATVAKMEVELDRFDVAFSSLVIKPIMTAAE